VPDIQQHSMPRPHRDTAAVDSVDFVWSIDAEGRLVYLSEGYVRVTGRPVGTTLGQRLRDLPWFRVSPAMQRYRDAVLTAHRPIRDLRIVTQDRDGAVRLLSVSGQPRFDQNGGLLGYDGIAIDVTDSTQAEAVLDKVARAAGDATGQDYFRGLVRSLAEGLGADLVFVGRLAAEPGGRIVTLAVHTAQGPAANFVYPLAGTPCAEVVGGQVCAHATGVAGRFPLDHGLAERGIDAYCGAPLFDSRGKPLGLLAVAKRTAFDNIDLVRNVLQVFAGRAAAELERETIEASLRESREWLLQSQRLGRTGYVVTDVAAGRVIWSDTMFEIRGVAPRPSFSFAEALAFIHPDDLPLFDAARAQSQLTRGPYDIELRVIRPDGQVIWERSIGLPEFDGDGELARRVVFVQDITERKRAELALRKAEAERRAILDNAPIAIFLKDRDGRYRLVNKRFEQWFGRSQQALEGVSDVELAPPDVVRMSQDTDRQVLRLGANVEYERPTYGSAAADHAVEHIQVTKFPIRGADGDVTGIAGFLSDISARRQAEAALRQSEERFRALIEHSNDLVAIVALDGALRYYSPSVTESLGFGESEFAGRSILDLVHRDDVAHLATALRRIALTPGARETGEGRVRHKDGGWRHIAWSARNAIDVPGVNGVIVNGRDVTAAKRLEEQLLQAQKMEAVGQLAGGIAHDFNNIIGVVLGFAGFLLDDLPQGSRQRGFAERIAKAGDRAKDLVRQILAFSRHSGVERRPEDLARLLEDTADLLRGSLPSSTAFALDPGPGGLVARVNTGQIGQVLLNLCLNANDALRGEPGRIAIVLDRVAPGAVEPTPADGHSVLIGTLDPGRAYARITVSDTGSGMPPEVLRRVFDPFFTTKERGRGTGLGLAVVHGIVTASDGACLVTSRPGAGTTFRIHLPLVAGAQAREARAAARQELRGRERVLVIDDEPDMADMLTIGLDRLGYDTAACTDPREALAAFEADPKAWDVVLCDQVMPHIKGLTLLARLRALNPEVRLVLCTGFSDGTTEDGARRHGVDAFFLKPVTVERLAATIRELRDRPPVAAPPSA